ncbi:MULTISPECIES: M4 family metallopeptidase [Streptomyces]|uniref:Neutral metalloproteinase n=1 Tax=Streptomyces qinglanensis TaxID=943816 RepID=A0A1E7K8K6_9ACTN|nr:MULTISPECIES: M4 family metallopeptidase [Streptomyces]OEV00258.1 peptidase [Streptomyces qinglanensis]OEV13937.1 peptidase [Streptomyces nanshensis]
MRFTSKQRISALAATAALVAAGVTAGTAGAAPAGETTANGALPAQLTASQHTELVKTANTEAAKSADARALGLGSKEKLHVKDVVKNKDGSTHVRYERTYDGLPVLGGDLVVHKSASGKRTGASKATRAKIAVKTSAPAAHKPVKAEAKGSKAPRKIVWAGEGKPVLAWETVVGGVQKSGAPNQLHVITDARTGKKLFEFQGIKEGTGNSQYSGKVEIGTSGSSGSFTMKDDARGGNRTSDLNGGQSGEGTVFTDDDDVWGDGTTGDPATAGVDAHYGAGQTWDYYKQVHGREGIAGDGKGALSRVHYGDNYVNAFWDDSCFCMTYGDGQGNKNPLTSLDVAAHEMSHGVTSTTANLEYAGESGGLNEATSDIFAAAVEFHADSPDDVPDYLVGEKIDINGDGTPLRWMDEPSKDGSSLDYWSPEAGDVDVHYSSGIANHFFFLLSVGSGEREVNGVKYDSPTKNGEKLDGIGIEKAEQIWFKALTEQMTSTTDYADARKATVQSATDLYGADSAEVKAVKAAWTGVNVTGS